MKVTLSTLEVTRGRTLKDTFSYLEEPPREDLLGTLKVTLLRFREVPVRS